MNEVESPDLHCRMGQKLLRKVPMFEVPAEIVRHHHTRQHEWDGQDNDQVKNLSQILLLADILDRSIDRNRYILHQDGPWCSTSAILAGDVISGELVRLLRDVSVREDFWLDLVSPRLYSILLNSGVCRGIELGHSHLLNISEMFADMIDFRSRFTSTHSSGVAAAASTLARLFGFTDSEVELMEVAGNLHDLGKMAIPTAILNKPGKLTTEEFAIMRQHTYFTYNVLSTNRRYPTIAEWAAFHHERWTEVVIPSI
jgi:HD-GYP domain-containing protein (c-di-GMP phosphodiesterase class II)